MAEVLLFPTRPTPLDPPDRNARESALDVRRSFIVEAPAGSGKTGLLLQRFLKLLADVDEPGQVLAITFTVKATAELRERVLRQLDNAAHTPVTSPFEEATRAFALAVLERDRQLHWGLRDNPHLLRIRTIDSVCAEIARSLPVLSGSGGGLAPAPDSGPLHHEAAQRTLMRLGSGGPLLDAALRDLLLHRDGNLADCERLLAEMLAWRDQWGELIPLYGDPAALTDAALDRDVLPKLEHALDRAICAGLERLARSIPPDVLNELTQLAAEMGHAPGYQCAPSPIAHCAGVRTAPEPTAASLAHWQALIHLLVTADCEWRKDRGITGRNLKFEYDRKHPSHSHLCSILDQLSGRDDLLAAFQRVRDLPPATYPAEQWAVAKSLLRVLRHALIELQLVFAERGQCDFTEQALLARAALRQDDSADSLAVALGMKLQHLLVDEMQDTSTGQYELLELLTSHWDGHDQTVFLVGDPKQSIYRFRQARVERFLRTLETGLLGDLPLTPLRLTANFRSQAALVGEFNHDFSRVFPSGATSPGDVPFVSADAVREGSESLAAPRRWHAHLVPARSDLPDQAEADADEIVRLLQDLRVRPLPPGHSKPWTAAILVRTRAHLLPIVTAMKQAAVPYRAVEIDPLAERQEILDLLALTRALLHPADRTAWLSILRAPWCGLTIADLHLLSGADDRLLKDTPILDLLQTRGDLLSPDGCARLERLWTVMTAALGQRGHIPLATWVERTWRSLGGDLPLDIEARENTQCFFELLNEISSDASSIDPADLERRLQSLYAAPATTPNAVDLMTIHSAKGLEWDLVIVPSLERRGQSNRGRLLTWAELDSPDPATAPLLFAPIAGRGEPSHALNHWLRSIESSREANELKRLLYVACTRAREELHLFGTLVPSKEGVSAAANTLLNAAWPAAEEVFTNLLFAPPSATALQTPLALAAGTETASPTPLLYRIPLQSIMPKGVALVFTPDGTSTSPPPAPFHRPEGSFAARALGNAVHALLEQLAHRIASGTGIDAFAAELPNWFPRIEALLRSSGLSPTLVARDAKRVLAALQNTLADPIGQWLLAAHADAASERALTAWEPRRAGIRLDRIFRAGPTPLAPGDTHLWIVDFKTSAHSSGQLDVFLDRQRTAYTPQLTAYAEILRAANPGAPIRTMLFYPLIPAHTFWEPVL